LFYPIGYTLKNDMIFENEDGKYTLPKDTVFKNVQWQVLENTTKNTIVPQFRYFIYESPGMWCTIRDVHVDMKFAPHYPHFILLFAVVFITIFNIIYHF
jgi:hypothetical protein